MINRYASEKTLLMSADQLCTFLHEAQGLTDIDDNQATKLINEFEISDLKDQGYMTQDGKLSIKFKSSALIMNDKLLS